MGRKVFITMIILLLIYNTYQIIFYTDTKRHLESELGMKSEKIAEIVKYFIKNSIEKNYIIDELFYKYVFSEFRNFSTEKSEQQYLVFDEDLNNIRGNLYIDITKYKSKLKEIFKQRLALVEIENTKDSIVLAGYRSNRLVIVRYPIPDGARQSMILDEFRENLIQKYDMKDIKILRQKDRSFSKSKNIDTENVEKEITILDSINDEVSKYYIYIVFDITAYNRTVNKNMMDIIFSISISFIIIIFLIVYNFLNLKYIETKEYLKEKEKEILLGSVAAGVAHEIRNPLNSINYSIEFLKTFVSEEKAQKYFSIIMGEIQRIDKTLREFLDIRKEITIEKAPIVINDILKEIIFLVEAEYKSLGIHLEYKENAVLQMEADRDRIKEVLINILKNAKEALDGREKKHIEVSVSKNNIKIIDTGIGMSEEEAEEVFSLYFTTKDTGSGIGLFRAKKIIEAHNGEIVVKSRKGIGTEIGLYFKKL